MASNNTRGLGKLHKSLSSNFNIKDSILGSIPAQQVLLQESLFTQGDDSERELHLVAKALVTKWNCQENDMIKCSNVGLDIRIHKFRDGSAQQDEIKRLVTTLLHRFDLNTKANTIRELFQVTMIPIEEWQHKPQPEFGRLAFTHPALFKIMAPWPPEGIGRPKYLKPANYVVEAILKSDFSEHTAASLALQSVSPVEPEGEKAGMTYEMVPL